MAADLLNQEEAWMREIVYFKLRNYKIKDERFSRASVQNSVTNNIFVLRTFTVYIFNINSY